jgi:hypothetical protein
MSTLPPPDPERNRQLVAERLGWPPEALKACRDLEAQFPRWMVFWTNGATTGTEPGYRASLQQHGHKAELYASTTEDLLDQIAAVDVEVPPPFQMGAFTPLV